MCKNSSNASDVLDFFSEAKLLGIKKSRKDDSLACTNFKKFGNISGERK